MQAAADHQLPNWKPWKGEGVPVRLGDRFQVRYADGVTPRPKLADDLWLLPQLWELHGNSSDIVAVRVVG